MSNTFTNEELDERALQFKINIVDIAKDELLWWRDEFSDNITESAEGQLVILEEYYMATGKSVGQSESIAEMAAANNRAWSAAFISYCIKQSGVTEADGFNFSSRHLTYITHAIVNRENGNNDRPFWFYDLAEHEPEIGDLVCLNRSYRYDSNKDGQKDKKKYTTWSYEKLKLNYIKEENGIFSADDEIKHVSHTDIVVDKYEDSDGTVWIQTIGGNVGNTVDTKEFRLDNIGQIDLIRKSNGKTSKNHHAFGYIHIIGSMQ